MSSKATLLRTTARPQIKGKCPHDVITRHARPIGRQPKIHMFCEVTFIFLAPLQIKEKRKNQFVIFLTCSIALSKEHFL